MPRPAGQAARRPLSSASLQGIAPAPRPRWRRRGSRSRRHVLLRHRAAGSHCDYDTWAGAIQSLVPDAYAFSSAASDTSTDGATNFAARFGDSWNQYIYHACVTGNAAEHQVACEHSNAAGNCIYDGGADMYDIGNVIMTSLMKKAGRAHPGAGYTGHGGG